MHIMTLREALQRQKKQSRFYIRNIPQQVDHVVLSTDFNRIAEIGLDTPIGVIDVNRIVPRGAAFERYSK